MSSSKVLLVDDNATTRKLVRFALQNKGYVVVEAADGGTALRLMEEHRPALVLQDLMLPDIDGFTLVGQLRETSGGKDAAVLAFSGFVSQLEEARLFAVGFDDIIHKPIEPSRLVAIVASHLPTAAPQVDRFGAGRRLLVVDDDPIQLRLTRFRLSRLGFEVQDASDGEQALEHARSSLPDAIVSDVMMPRLDGFGLSLAVRREPVLAHIPVVLVTSSYVEPADRALARRAGASDLVARTPDLDQLIVTLRRTLSADAAPHSPVEEPSPELEGEHNRRVLLQLERQVRLASGLSQRCSLLAAELRVLTGISETVLRHRDIEGALDEALTACFDAAGISLGALYLLDAAGSLRARPVGGDASRKSDELRTFFGHEAVLRQIIASGTTTSLPSRDVLEVPAERVLESCGATSALIVPLADPEGRGGALFLAAKGRDLSQDDWRVFARGVASQIAQTLALAAAFLARETAEREALEQRRIASERAEVLRRILDSIAGLAESLGLAEVAAAHHRVLAALDGHGREPATELSEEFLTESLTPFAAAFRGYAESNARLTGLNAELGERNRELVDAKHEADRANQELESFSYSVSHDLRAPLRRVDGFSRALLERHSEKLSDQGRNCLGQIRAAAERMGDLIEDLLRLSLVGRADLSRTRIDLAVIAHAVLQDLQRKDPERSVSCHIHEAIWVEADPRLTRVLLENLLGNAWKFTAKTAHASIEVGAEQRPGSLICFVRDNGAGFDMQYVGRLFSPFQRLHSEADFPGTGIGLATVRRIVNRHGGQVEAHGAIGEGARISFTLASDGTRLP